MDPRKLEAAQDTMSDLFSRARRCPGPNLPTACAHLHDFLQSDDVVALLVKPLLSMDRPFVAELETLRNKAVTLPDYLQTGHFTPETRETHASLALAAIAVLASVEADKSAVLAFFIRCLAEYLTAVEHDLDNSLHVIHTVVLDDLQDFLTQRIYLERANRDDHRVFDMLVTHRKRVEWFRRARTRALAEKGIEGQVGAAALAIDLLDHLMAQDLDLEAPPTWERRSEAVAIAQFKRDRDIVLGVAYVGPNDNPDTAMSDVFRATATLCAEQAHTQGLVAIFVNHHDRPVLDRHVSTSMPTITVGDVVLCFSITDIFEQTDDGKPRTVIAAAALSLEDSPI